MAAEQGQTTTSVIARSDPYAEIEPFSQRLIAEESHKWCAAFPWDYPKASTKEVENDFLLQYFTSSELHVHSPKFLAQVWKCIALYNAQFRIPAVVEKWIAESTELLKDSDMVQYALMDNAQPSTVFGDSELTTYPDAFLKVALKGIQTRLKSMGVSPEDDEIQKSAPAVITSNLVVSAGNKVEPTTETVPSTTTAAGIQAEAPKFAATNEKAALPLEHETGQQQVPAMTTRTNPTFHRSNGASNGVYAPPDHHRQLNYKKPRGQNNKRNSFSARNGPRPLAPPGFEHTHQPSNHFGGAYAPPPAPNPATGLPFMMTGRGPSGGYQFGGNEQMPPPHLQFQQSHGPQSGAYMPPVLSAHAPRYPVDPGVPGPRLYDPTGHGTQMIYNGPYAGPQQDMPLMTERTNLQHNAQSFSFEGPTNMRDGRAQQRNDSVTSRAGKRGYGGSMRGRGSISNKQANPDTTPRYIIQQRDKDPLAGPWRNNHSENVPLPSQDARNSITEIGPQHRAQPHVQTSSAGTNLFDPNMRPAIPQQPHAKPSFSTDLCRTTCTKDAIADDCTTATKLVVFDAPADIDEDKIKAFFGQWGEVTYIGGPKPATANSTTQFNIWITFATAAEARKCLAARGAMWPFGNRYCLQVEVAKQHWDETHRVNKPQYVPSAPSFIPRFTTQGPRAQYEEEAAVAVKTAADSVVSLLSEDTTPTASGPTTPKKKPKGGKKKKSKKNDLLAEATNKALAEDEPRSDHKSGEGDQLSSTVVQDEVLALGEPQIATINDQTGASADTKEHSGTDMSTLKEQPANDSLSNFHPSAMSNTSTTLAVDNAPPSGGTVVEPKLQTSDGLPAITDNEKAELDSSKPGPGNHESQNLGVDAKLSSPVKADTTVEQQSDQVTSGEGSAETPKSSVQSPSSLKSSKKAPIPKIPGHKVPSALPNLTVEATPPAPSGPGKDKEQKANDVKHKAGELEIPKQRSASDGSEGTTLDYLTAPNTPAVPRHSSVGEESKGVKQTKAKGPDQTESLSVFSSKTKTKRKASKPTKTKGSIKGKPSTSDGFASPSSAPSRVTSDAATPAPQDQPLQGQVPLQAAAVRESVDAPRPYPEQSVHEMVTAKAAVSASEVTSPTSVPTTKAARRGTLGTIMSWVKGGSQPIQNVANGSDADSKIEEQGPEQHDSANASTIPATTADVGGPDRQAQGDTLESVGLGISGGATDGQAAEAQSKSKKKKAKSKSKKEPQAELTAGDVSRTGTDVAMPLYEYPEGDARRTDSSASSDSLSSRMVKAAQEAQKGTRVIEPKPMRKTHKRSASNKVASQDSAEQSTASAGSNRRASKGGVEHMLLTERIEDVTDLGETETDVTDPKVFDSKSKKADANDRVSPEVEEMRARLNKLHQKELEVKQNKGKEKADVQ